MLFHLLLLVLELILVAGALLCLKTLVLYLVIFLNTFAHLIDERAYKLVANCGVGGGGGILRRFRVNFTNAIPFISDTKVALILFRHVRTKPMLGDDFSPFAEILIPVKCLFEAL